MDGYPVGALDHNVPFLVASGLNTTAEEPKPDAEPGAREVQLRSDIPDLDGQEADVIRNFLEEVDVEGQSWAGVDKGTGYRFRVKLASRLLHLPPRRAELTESVDETDAPPILHSPFSPLSPSSALYPDGLIDAQWIKKHQELVPSIYACFYKFASDPGSDTAHDSRLKTDVNRIKGALVKSGYKTKLMLILLGDVECSPGSLPDGVQERLESVRREAGLDPKSIFYIPPQESPDELRRVIGNILGVLYSSAVEYYRDLGRHAKKKRSRGIVPQPTVPPTGTSHTLSLPDWNFRYDFKSGILAEFRQETDAAIRSLEQAYEILLGSDVLDVIPSWSPRWNDGRLLADIIAIRCIRIHFWMGQTSLAVRRWRTHRDRIGDFVDRRGMGINNYGWHAWEARWATVMANMIEKLNVPGLAPSTTALFLEADKSVAGERLQPWELLHHTGYWYRMAAAHLVKRRTLAHMIPDEDRVAPDSTSKSKGASKSLAYDTFLCPEPYEELPLAGDGEGVNHAKLILESLGKARTQFQSRRQLRMSAELALDSAREMSVLERWDEVMTLLRPLWEDMSFRTEEWSIISEDLCWMLRRAAVETGQLELVVAIDWELMDRKFTRRKQWHYDLGKSLDGVSCSEKPSISLEDGTVPSFISAAFVFRNKEGKAGETCEAQLSLTSHAHVDAVPVPLNSIRVDFEGSVKPIILRHKSADAAVVDRIHIETVQLEERFGDESDEEAPSELSSQRDLTLRPGQTRVFELTIPLREAGEATASSVVFSVASEQFDLDYRLRFRDLDAAVGWHVPGFARPRHARSDARTLQVQPRPPKLQIRVVDPLDQYYANELVELVVELLNSEDESATTKLDIHVFGQEVPSFNVSGGSDQAYAVSGTAEEARITAIPLGKMSSSATSRWTIAIDPASGPTTLDLHLRATYHLESDAATPIMQMLTYQLNVVNAFEANYDLVPRLHPDPWPSVFDFESVAKEEAEEAANAPARGFAQKWCLMCHYASFAHEDLEIVGMDMQILSIVGGARCSVETSPEMGQDGLVVSPKMMHEAQFGLVAQKLSLDDRHPVSLDLAFVIKWKRSSAASDRVNTTTMLVGKYVVLGTEPRVLASVYHQPPTEPSTTKSSESSPPPPAQTPSVVQLDLTLENPSGHFLTFGLGMEPSDEFAFSGAKHTTLHVLPMSRQTATYRLVPLVGGRHVRPRLVVRDKYFQKVLRIIPTEGMKLDKEGLLIWVPGAVGDEQGEEEGEEGDVS